MGFLLQTHMEAPFLEEINRYKRLEIAVSVIHLCELLDRVLVLEISHFLVVIGMMIIATDVTIAVALAFTIPLILVSMVP